MKSAPFAIMATAETRLNVCRPDLRRAEPAPQLWNLFVPIDRFMDECVLCEYTFMSIAAHLSI